MSSTHEETIGRVYYPPEINKIRLDNEISLALESNAPYGPGENQSYLPDNFNNNPLKSTNV